jgi:hypothetical protein
LTEADDLMTQLVDFWGALIAKGLNTALNDGICSVARATIPSFGNDVFASN